MSHRMCSMIGVAYRWHEGGAAWEGMSWMWFVGGGGDIPLCG